MWFSFGSSPLLHVALLVYTAVNETCIAQAWRGDGIMNMGGRLCRAKYLKDGHGNRVVIANQNFQPIAFPHFLSAMTRLRCKLNRWDGVSD